jgi:hypothetical protein
VFPIRFEVPTEKRARLPGFDGNGNPRFGFEAARRQGVYGWQDTNSFEPKLAGPERIVVDVELFTPESFECAPKDRVYLNGTRFEVVGYPEDANNGPFGFRPGYLVNLRRVEG